MSSTLVLRIQSSLPFNSFVLEPGTFILGRSSRCDVVVKDTTISRRHAEFTVKGTCVSVRDLGSLNGTFLDDQRIGRCSVQCGQRLRFGSVPFLVVDSALGSDAFSSELETERCDSVEQTLNLETARLLLSRAQQRVFVLLLRGFSEKQVAEQLYLSSCTVHNHAQEIHRILKVHSGKELLARFVPLRNR